MKFDNELRQIKVILYKLKHLYGQEITIYRRTTNTYDVKTGKSTIDYTQYKIKKAIVLESKMVRDFVYDLSFVAANKNFTYGGFFDITSRLVIIDYKDLSRLLSTYVPDLNDHVIFNNRRYEIAEVYESENFKGLVFKIKELKGSPVEQRYEEVGTNAVGVVNEGSQA